MYGITAYLYEKMAFVFGHDFIRINGIEVQTEDNISEANADIIVEQVNLFETYNGADIGSVDEAGAVLTNGGGFILRE